ncbi:hypothetical protein [Corallococcus coralloides]|nr:hypothetical protein [Corallococcus coralloides]
MSPDRRAWRGRPPQRATYLLQKEYQLLLAPGQQRTGQQHLAREALD